MRALTTLAALAACAHALQAQAPASANLTVIYAFPGPNVGAPGSIFEESPGLFYGQTWGENQSMGGEVFSIEAGGTPKPSYQFQPLTAADFIVPTESGALFGISSKVGYPSFFTIGYNGSGLKSESTTWGLALGYPPVIPALDGSYFSVLGPDSNSLSIAKVDTSGDVTVIHSFTGDEGTTIIGSTLLRGPDGSFYGINTLPNNGSSDGWVYRYTPEGQFIKLGIIPNFDWGPSSPLALGPDGTIYGAFYGGGAYNAGGIYKIPPGGQFTELVHFPGNGGMQTPASLFMDDDGNLYGTTHTVTSRWFRVLLPSGKLEELYADGGAKAACTCPMFQGSDGKLYGVSHYGGPAGAGSIFSLDVGLAPPKPRITLLSPTSGAPGSRVLLWGANLLGATSVTFNGAPATTIQIPASYAVWVDVPSGATTGPVTITTPNGSFTTTTDFTIE